MSSLRLASYNVLNSELALRPRHGPYEEHVHSWTYRRRKIAEQLVEHKSDIIALQEVTTNMAADIAKDMEGFVMIKSDDDLSVTVAADLPQGVYNNHAPVLLIRSSSVKRIISSGTFKLNSISTIPITTAEDRQLMERFREVGNDARVAIAHLALPNDAELIVVSVHLHMDPSEPHIKVMQICSLMEYILQSRRSRCNIPIVIAGDFNSIVQKFSYDVYDNETNGGVWDGNSSLNSGVYQLMTSGMLPSNHNDHPSQRVKGVSKSDIRLSLSFSSAYKHVNGKEPYITTKCRDFAATLDYIFVDNDSLKYDKVGVTSIIPMPYNDQYDSSVFIGENLVKNVVSEIGPAIPNDKYPSDHPLIGCCFVFSGMVSKRKSFFFFLIFYLLLRMQTNYRWR